MKLLEIIQSTLPKTLMTLALLGALSPATQAQNLQLKPIPMRKEYIGEHLRKPQGVHYYSESSLEKFRVYFENGLLVDASGEPITSYSNLGSIYVIDPNDALYLSRYSKQGLIHHSSLSRGLSMLSAGQLIVMNGRLRAIDLQSGHYRHPSDYFEFLEHYFRTRGIPMKQVLTGMTAVDQNLHLLKENCNSLLTGTL